jgi:beta-lactam-binding protein with PASTA domain
MKKNMYVCTTNTNASMELLTKLKNFIFSKQFLKHLGLVVLVYFIVVGGTILYLDSRTNHGQKIKVPSLVGKNINSIKSTVEELGLTYEVLDSIYNPNKPEGTILNQDPRPTDSTEVFVKEGRVIKLRVSKRTRMVEMPGLISRGEQFGLSVLKNRGLKYTITYVPTTESNGAILNQQFKGKVIKEGTRLPIGSTILLTIGKNSGGAPIQIPDLYGLTINELKERLIGLGSVTLNINCPECATAADSASVRVNSQSPEYLEGQLSPPGSTISVQMKKELDSRNVE